VLHLARRGPYGLLRALGRPTTISQTLEPEPLIYREEVTAILIALSDISANTSRIVDLLEGEDGEEEDSEADT
jgi:hypothetical protein